MQNNESQFLGLCLAFVVIGAMYCIIILIGMIIEM